MSTVTSKSTKQSPAGRLAFLADYNPKMLLQKEAYVAGLKGSALTFFGILSILALYMMIAVVSILNAIHFIRTRTAPKSDSPTPPGDFEQDPKPAQEVGLNMDDVQEIPGEVEFAAMKEVMPADDQIPDIDEPQDEREHAILSDDDSTLVGQDELVGVKGSPVVVPSVPTIKEDFERPISPPATPPTRAAAPESPTVEVVEVLQTNPRAEEPVVEIVPDKAPVEQEPPKADVTNSVEAAAKAVEEHAKIVQDATSPTDSVGVSPKPADSPISEFVFVPSEAPAKPVEEVVVPPVEAVVTQPVEAVVVPPVEVSTSETKEVVEPVVEPTPAPVPVPEVAAPEVAPTKAEPEPEAPTSLMNEPEPEVVAALVEEPESVEEPKPVEAPKLVEEPKAVEEPKVVEEPKAIEEPKAVEPKPVEAPKPVAAAPIPTPVRKSSQDSHRSSQDSVAPKSLGRPRVMRKATTGASAVSGVTSTVAGITPAAVSVSAPVVDKPTSRETAMRRADDALNKLASSLLRSNTADRLPARSESPKPSAIPRAIPSRSSSPVTVPRSESPSSDAAGSRPASPAPGMARRGSVALANALRPTVSRSSTLANVTNAPERKFTNPPRGGSVSPPPLPAPPQRRGSQDTPQPQRQGSQGSVRGSPQVPQAAVMSPSVLSRKATIDANGSPGSPPRPTARPPAEEFTTSRRNVPFPSAPDGNQPVVSAVRPKPRPRTSTTGGTNASLLATLGAKVTFPSNPPNPARSDSIASAVSNQNSIPSVSDMSDMDASSPIDFPSREGIRMGLGRFDSCGSMSSDGMSGDDEEKRKRRAKRRSKARAQSLKKQKRSKRN